MKIKLNKKHILFGGLAVLVFIFALVFWLAGISKKDESTKLNCYTLCLEYDHENYILRGIERVEYTNNSENMFSSLYFHLYPNAFRQNSKNGVVSQNNFNEAYPNGESYGKIEINEVCFEDSPATYEICGEDFNILKIDLKEELFPQECVSIEISFTTTLANINHRLGYGENTINFGNFYPIACVYEEGNGFCQSLYHSNGDPFYSDCANYNVEVSYNSNFEIASTGDKYDDKTKGEYKTTSFIAKKVRDFCFILSPKFEVATQLVGDVEVKYYGYKGDKNISECLQTSADALKTFENMFGSYPYSQLSIVKSNFVHGGMEYPNIVLISDEILDQRDVNYVIIHEIAHQWWYGLVGNDEYNHAWLDEGLAEYSTLLFFRENPEYGEKFDELIDGALKSWKLFVKVYKNINGKVDTTMTRALCEFATEPEYVQCTYTRGVLMFNSLRETIGDKKFIACLREYLEKFKYQNSTPAHLISIFASKCGKDVEGFFNSWLNGKVFL